MSDKRLASACARCLAAIVLCSLVDTMISSTTFAQTRESSAPLANESSETSSARKSLTDVKAAGVLRSRYRKQLPKTDHEQAPRANLQVFRNEIEPVLKEMCVQCHGADLQEGNIRIDTLNPDLLHGTDVDWWLEVFAVLSNGEMPPADADELADDDRTKIVDWLSTEIQVASQVRRAEQGHSSFRRMTRYEYNYALQDLLGLPYDFAKDLPPDPISEDGFRNSSELLHMSATQFETYREAARRALNRAVVVGEQPKPLYWAVSMKAAAERADAKVAADIEKKKKRFKDDPEKLKLELEAIEKRRSTKPRGAHFAERITGEVIPATWRYSGAKYAFAPTTTLASAPESSDYLAVIPPHQKLIVELGDQVPDRGTLRVRFRASRVSVTEEYVPSLQLEFGWQASNDSQASVRISDHDIEIDAEPDVPQFYQWDIPLSEIYPRNSVRNISKMGDLPSPSEYVKFVNSSVSQGDIQIDYVEITAPVYDRWPPASHTRIFFDSASNANEIEYASEILSRFMPRAWRRNVSTEETEQKLELFKRIRPECDNVEQAIVEVLASVLASPNFLYVIQAKSSDDNRWLTDSELATRLSMFLWCSTPDDELLKLAAEGKLHDSKVLASQTKRMLADARSSRFSKHFVRQWLGMDLLDYLNVDRKAYPQFDASLKEAMQEEPIAFFNDMLQRNSSVIDFIHADATMANERLAKHYGLNGVYGNDFRRVSLKDEGRRGGLLTQAGLLAMNSDGKDSHPLKRGIWMLERLLNDPPPPPPPAVPEIDLADPEIAKLTLKQRIENHRDHAACMSCHVKIDPWGIAFENFDAAGSWRTQIDGKPVDSTSYLFNKQELDGMDGLKRFLLEHRQDQFTRALVHKMTTYALGRPLSFGDRSSIDRIAADLRKQDDGLATLVQLVVSSDLFRTN